LTWKIEFDTDVEKDLRKLGNTAQKRILAYLKEKIIPSDDPRALGKSLSGDLAGLWRVLSQKFHRLQTELFWTYLSS